MDTIIQAVPTRPLIARTNTIMTVGMVQNQTHHTLSYMPALIKKWLSANQFFAE